MSQVIVGDQSDMDVCYVQINRDGLVVASLAIYAEGKIEATIHDRHFRTVKTNSITIEGIGTAAGVDIELKTENDDERTIEVEAFGRSDQAVFLHEGNFISRNTDDKLKITRLGT